MAQITTPAANSPTARDADLLAADMRVLATDPRDIDALLGAGEAATRLGDLSAAGSLFGRVERIAPANARLKAGLGSLMVRAERPGEALRRFAEADAAGLDASRYAADRALAYDLTGDQPRAQRDYRAALKTAASDEVLRRYALSLGISGKRDEALAQLVPLIRRGDRAAWRDRAFVLAMTGDVPGAQRIATTTLPAGVGQALSVFFARLTTLGPVDRAWAVHFGELRPTPERVADARLAPRLSPLPPEPKPVQLAAAAPPTKPLNRDEQRRLAREERRARERGVQVAARTATPALRAAPAPALAPPPAASPPLPVRVAQAPASIRIQPAPAPLPTPSARFGQNTSAAVRVAAAPVPAPIRFVPMPAPVPPAPVLVAAASQPRVPVPSPAPVPLAIAMAAPAVEPSAAGAALSIGAARLAAADPLPRPGFATASEAVAPMPSPVLAPAPAPAPPPPSTRAASEDSILARIVAGITIPAAELDVPPVRPAPVFIRPAPSPVPSPPRRTDLAAAVPPHRTVPIPAEPDATPPARKRSATSDPAAIRKGRVGIPLGDAGADTPIAARAGSKARQLASAETTPAKSRAAKGRSADDSDDTPISRVGRKGQHSSDEADPPARTKLAVKGTKARNTRDTSDEQDTKAPRGRSARQAKAEAPRIWVQVAGGANGDDLDKAWGKVKSQAPDAFRGKRGYKTPLRATNRVLTGPFKSDEEAQAFVNQLKRKGVGAFQFSSSSGQKVEKLDE